MKKNYQKPAMRVVELRHMGIICASGSKMVTGTKTNFSDTDDEIKYGGSDEEFIQNGGFAR